MRGPSAIRLRNAAYSTLAILCMLLAWQLAGSSSALGMTVPPPAKVLAIFRQGTMLALLARSAAATLSSALGGLAAGTLLGTMTALAAHLIPLLRPGLDRLAVTLNAIPAIALGPIFILMIGREMTPALLATIPVFFIMYVAVRSGLRSASVRLSQMLTTFGARQSRQLLYLDIPSALPAFLSGLKVSITAAMIGTIVGEWFGAPGGLGVVILNTMQNFQIPLMWASVLLVAVLSLAGFGLLNLAERWAEWRFT